jgi:phage gp36-like protein
MISARAQNSNEILIDFGSPVVSTGVLPSQFSVTGSTVNSVTFLGNQYATLSFSSPLPFGETWLEYTSPINGAQILRVGGWSSDPANAFVKSFEVLVLDLSTEEPAIYNVANTLDLPELGDFIDAFGLEEAIRITNAHSNSATQPDELKFKRALEDAESLWNSELLGASAAALLTLNPGKRRTLLTIVRYFLDSSCPRKHVIEAYNEVIRNLQRASSGGGSIDEEFTGLDEDFFWYEKTGCDTCSCKPTGIYDSWLR